MSGILKDVGFALISELIKNSRISDRELAKRIGVSQPTVSRIRSRLEKEGFIREYTLIPDFVKLGFQIASFILVKMRTGLSEEEIKKARQVSLKDMAQKAPNEIVLFERGMGSGYSGVLISFHRNYSEFTELMTQISQYSFIDPSATLSFLIDLNDEVHYRYFTFSTLAKHILALNEKKVT